MGNILFVNITALLCKLVPVSCELVDGDARLGYPNPWLENGHVLGNPGSVGGVLALPTANPWLSSCHRVLHIVGPKFSIKTLLNRVRPHSS